MSHLRSVEFMSYLDKFHVCYLLQNDHINKTVCVESVYIKERI
jgi:hypothetical protein